MNRQKTFTRTAIAAGLALACAGAHAEADVAALQQRLNQMEQEMAALRAELSKVAAQAPVQEQKVAEIETRVAKVETAPAPVAAPAKEAGNRVFFRGGYSKMPDDRSNQAFTDMINVPGAIGLADIENKRDDGWYFGAGFDFLLSRDTLGLIPGAWTIAELGLEFRNMGSKDAHLIGPVAECLLLNEVKAGGVPGALNCTNIKGKQNLMMLTVSAAPKIKFMEGSKLRPWIIPAGLDLNVVSPPSDSTNYLDIGVQFAAGVDYEIMPGITLGADLRYHLSADLTDPDYDAGAVAAAGAAGLAKGLSLNTKQNLDVWTAGISLGIAF
jgi:opacity protein-like surface antigen